MDSKNKPNLQQRIVPSQKDPLSAQIRNFMKDPKRMLTAAIFILLLGIVPLASALTYTVQEGDTLTALAKRYNTSIEAIVADNDIQNPNLILIGQQLEISENTIDTSATTSTTASSMTDGAALKAALDAQFNVPSISPTSHVNPDVGIGQSCMRFNFLQGNDAATGSRDGVFILFEKTNGALASWYGAEGATDSGWINGFNITHNEVHVQVLFYPNDGHNVPVLMEIVNHAPDSTYGWLSRGRCHAIEIQYAN